MPEKIVPILKRFVYFEVSRKQLVVKLISIIFSIFIFCNTYSQELPTILEVFDFNIGDEFHYKAYGGMGDYPHAFRVKMIDRINDSSDETIKYVRAWDNYYSTYEDLPEPHLVYHASQYIDTLLVTLIDSTIDWYLINEENFDTIAGDTLFELKLIIINRYDICDALSYNFQWGDLDIFGHGSSYGVSYIKGLGRVSSFEQLESQSGLETGRKLIYYNKGDSTCGIPDTTIITNYATANIENQISVFPNPCSDFISIYNLNTNLESTFRIFNLTGKLIFETIRSSSEIINVNYLQPGIYLLQILQPQNSYVLRFQKI